MYAYSNASLNIISEDIGAKNTTEIYITIKTCIFSYRILLCYMYSDNNI